MNQNTLQNDDEPSSESPLEITQGGLWSPLPIHAYRVLGKAKEHIAKDVLVCLVSHLGYAKKNKWIYPSYKTICRESGRSSNSVSKGIRTLEEFGFIRKKTIQVAQTRKRNKYAIQESCYQTNLMGEKARSYLSVFGRCQCGGVVREGEYGIGLDGYHHYGCGALVFPLKSKRGVTLNEESSGRVIPMEIVNGTDSQSLQSTDSPSRGSEN